MSAPCSLNSICRFWKLRRRHSIPTHVLFAYPFMQNLPRMHWPAIPRYFVPGCEGEVSQTHSYPAPARSLRSACSDLTSSASNVASVLRHVELRGPKYIDIFYLGVGSMSGLTNLVWSVPSVIYYHVATIRSAGLHMPKFRF